MSQYQPPLKDMDFILSQVLQAEEDKCDAETRAAILEEAGKLASGVLDELNRAGDAHGARLNDDHSVTTAPGFKEAYQQYMESGWNSVPFPEAFGGQDLPWAVAFPVQEMWQSVNMSFGLCPLLNQGAVEAIYHHGSQAQKEHYLPKLISGEWTGTMNLTEPQAGSDLGLLKTKAEPGGDTYKITGQKIFITYGEHDLAENIIHLVLARLPEAPDDVRGISLFIVPKILEDGTRNDVRCIGLEHKLGIHGSPTCTMEFDGARGYLVGEAHMGLKYMFTMMNNARLSVGLQGVAIAERAYQHARWFAADRVQGKSFETGERVSIDHHPDVQRMLGLMRAQASAGRAMAYHAAVSLDRAAAGDAAAAVLVEVYTPIVKSWCTDMACSVASLGVQVFGGMGFVEETGAAQYYRDARILPIYEGTNGIQAQDLLFRKILRDGGAGANAFLDTVQGLLPGEMQALFTGGFEEARAVVSDIVAAPKNKQPALSAAAGALLEALAILSGGVMLARQAALSAQSGDAEFAASKEEDWQVFKVFVLPHATAHLQSVRGVL